MCLGPCPPPPPPVNWKAIMATFLSFLLVFLLCDRKRLRQDRKRKIVFFWIYSCPNPGSIEWLIIYRGPCFLTVVFFCSTPIPTPHAPPPKGRGQRSKVVILPTTALPPSPVSKLDRRHTGRLRKRDNMLTGEGWGIGLSWSPESYDRRKPGPL